MNIKNNIESNSREINICSEQLNSLIKQHTNFSISFSSIKHLRENMKNIQNDLEFKAYLLEDKCRFRLRIKKILKTFILFTSNLLIVLNSYMVVDNISSNLTIRIIIAILAPITMILYGIESLYVSTSHVLHMNQLKQQINYCSSLIYEFIMSIDDVSNSSEPEETSQKILNDKFINYVMIQFAEINKHVSNYIDGYHTKYAQKYIITKCKLSPKLIKILKKYMTIETFKEIMDNNPEYASIYRDEHLSGETNNTNDTNNTFNSPEFIHKTNTNKTNKTNNTEITHGICSFNNTFNSPDYNPFARFAQKTNNQKEEDKDSINSLSNTKLFDQFNNISNNIPYPSN